MIKTLFFKLRLQLLLLIAFPVAATAQRLDWNLNIAKPFTFTSLNVDDDPGVTPDKMWYVSMKDLMSLPANPNKLYGISGNLYDKVKGYAELSVYLYDPTPDDPDDDKDPTFGRGPLIFQCRLDKTSEPGFGDSPQKYKLGNWLAWWPDAGDNDGGFYFNDYWQSTDSRSAIMAAAFYNYNQRFSGWNSVESPGTAVIPYLSLADGDLKLPVIIELTVFKTNVSSINVPGIGIIEPGFFKPPYLNIQSTVTQVQNNMVDLDITVAQPSSDYKIDFSAIEINVSPYGDMTSKPLAHKTIFSSQVPYSNKDFKLYLANLDVIPGDFWVWASYDITITETSGRVHSYPNRQQFLANYTVSGGGVNFQRVFTINKQDYKGLPVFTLSGGMSAEYGIEKSLASLSSGISETWDVRMVDGKPDLKGGGPIAVYPDPNKFDFLDQSVKKTVQLYNDNLGATTEFNTVIIGTGVAHVPYVSNAMKAPFLPLHFLVSVHSVADIKRILDTAAADGYSAFSMMGYDPSLVDGVAWIKLRELPQAYKQFLLDHKVKNVILMGYKEAVASGEGGARRILIDGQPDDDFSQGAMYMMGHGALSTYKEKYRDFYRWNFGDEKLLVDWEGGITNSQIQAMSAQLKSGGLTAFTIQSEESLDFYQWATDIQMAIMEKNKLSPKMISMNEYLIGYPEYELYSGTVPYLYWQGGDTLGVAGRTRDYTDYKVKPFYQGGPFENIPVYFQAKYNRAPYVNCMKKYFTNVTQDTWQKADVWDPSDGMNAPCELVAEAITKEPEGAKFFADWNNKRAVFDFDDFTVMINNSIRPAPSADPSLFPKPSQVNEVKTIDDAGLTITQYLYDPNTYWQPPNFPNKIVLQSMASGYPGTTMGYLDGQQRPADIRKQSFTIAQYDLTNTSDEYDLRMAYKFNVTANDGLLSYDPKLGEEQKMDCFEFTSIPFNHWMDIPSRMMARSGALWVVNGGVYDFDYNGIPGVVPFIKKNGIIKAQPQILSFKGEAGFAWKWGANKSATILSRPRDVPATGLPAYMSTIFQDQTKNYTNVMAGMTFMTGKPGSGLYDIKALQPDWMRNYPTFPSYLLSNPDRCFFAPLSLNCAGTEIVAPIEEGWNDCGNLQYDSLVRRFSALAYQQFAGTFDDIPNARTFIAMKGNKLDIGILDGDYGKSNYRGRIQTKSLGMHAYEESQFCLAKGYDQFVNLDGGSSSQMWLNGRGPLQMMNSYVLKNDNQGPYYSRLLSSFIMLVPKLHTELIRQKVTQADPGNVPVLNNTNINFEYNDDTDLDKFKAYIDLSPCKDSLNKSDGSYGFIAGNFSMSQQNISKNGGILFYIGEDMFYPETKGISTVIPRLRNLMVLGVGLVLPSLVDTLMKLPVAGTKDPSYFRSHLTDANMSAYYIKVYDGEIVEFIFNANGKTKYLTGNHRFYLEADGQSSNVPNQNIFLVIDGYNLANDKNTYYYLPALKTGFLNMDVTTHAYMGALNLDGRYLTGDIAMKTYNYLFAVGQNAWGKIYNSINQIDNALQNNTLPDLGDTYYQNGIFAVQGLETSGQHVFALAPQGQNRFYGLRLNNFIFNKTKTPAKKPSKAKAK